MTAKKDDVLLVALGGVLAFGVLAAGCNAPAPPERVTGGERTSALADSAYNSMIDDPTTGTRDWTSPDPEKSGIAYWHVGWVSKKGSSGASVEYVVATGYHRVTRKEVVEVVIPQTESDVAYEVRMLPLAPEMDEANLAADIESISEGLASVLGGAAASREDRGTSSCVGGKATYKRPRDNRTLRRCHVMSSGYDSATGGATGAGDKPSSDPIVVFLNIALDIAKSVQEQAHCEPDVRPLDDDYREHPSGTDDWPDDCSNVGSKAGTGAGTIEDPNADSSGRTAGSSCPEVGKVCFSSDGSKRGVCGADYKCWQ